MKYVVLGANGSRAVYVVPNAVADNLAQYCSDFRDDWLQTSKEAKKFRKKGGLRFEQGDFIRYLNRYHFPTRESFFVENVNYKRYDDPLPDKYKDAPIFEF